MQLSSLVPLLISLGATLACFVWILCRKQFSLADATGSGTTILIVLGILNGVGMLLYGIIFALDDPAEVSKYSALATGMIPVVLYLSSVAFSGEQVKIQKIICIAGICVFAYFLRKS